MSLRRKLFTFALVLAMISLIVPQARAQGDTLHFHATVYSREAPTSLKVQLGSGWFGDVYEVDASDVTTSTQLANGLNRYEIEFGLDPEYSEGETVPIKLLKPGGWLGTTLSETVNVPVKKNASGELSLSVVLKEKIKQRFNVSFEDVSGAAITGSPSMFNLPLTEGSTGFSYQVKTDQSGTYFERDADYDENGQFISAAPTVDQAATYPNVTFGSGSSSKLYAIESVAPDGNSGFKVGVREVKLETIKYKVAIDRPFDVLGYNVNWQFNLNGEKSTKTNPKLNIPAGSGEFSTEITAVDVPEGARLSLGALPDEYMYYSVADQNFDPATNTLHVTLGKKVYFTASDIKELNYNDFGVEHARSGFELGLFDSAGKLIETSAFDNGYPPRCLFEKVVPGEYTVKVLKAPADMQAGYDLEKGQAFKLTEDGRLQIKAISSGSPETETWINPDGGTDSRFDNTAKAKALIGYKTPLRILVPKTTKFEKAISNPADNPKQAVVSVGDEVEFTISGTIPGDHRLIMKHDKWVDFGVKNDISVVDTLDERFEFVAGSLKVLEDGQQATNYSAKYDEGKRQISLVDNEKAHVSEFDFNKKISYRAEKKVSVTFKAKVLQVGDKPLLNVIPGDEVEVVPYLDLLVKKRWNGGDELIKDLDPEKYLDNFQIETWQNDQKVKSEPVRTYLKQGSLKTEGKNFEFRLVKLPKYSTDELAKPANQRVPFSYKVVENLPEELQGKFEVKSSVRAGEYPETSIVEFENAFVPPTPEPTPSPTPTPSKTPKPKPGKPKRSGLPKTGGDLVDGLGAVALLLAAGSLAVLARRRRG
ncbi:isopeptide-forming domain-containing fimbrial protein [Propionimicrobium lymphophilum]|uniref:isopeptide-forming domain-containing fimbrial protein n=1 Tax=Propionimicrobium TaxID=203133 RepID=UPI0003D799FC|nr:MULTISPECIES: isopeptide-forming domain-containing fimbrial protein [Propionimicrobium]ETJ98203.1 fimbrial isopeptide formation D2 domain protein [Propionimicrobium sp. BV2F7]MDK7709363.1 isopeptide-forming domain-containing fimbrial protein [Propionimicrobium lymphophilum]MDK7733350.1 isopeptide-forming domain-containing fimbrial protein [Propionimicrobium lymphophilum]